MLVRVQGSFWVFVKKGHLFFSLRPTVIIKVAHKSVLFWIGCEKYNIARCQEFPSVPSQKVNVKKRY